MRKIENCLSLSEPGSYDYITYLRTRIEYSLFLCLGFLWKNFNNLSPQKQNALISNLNNLSIGSAVAAIRDLSFSTGEIVNKKCGKILDSYPQIRNAKIGHGYEVAAPIASELSPLYDAMIKTIPLLQEESDIIVVQRYDYTTNNYVGIRFPSNQYGQGVHWSCPQELISCSETEFPRTYILFREKYYKISPFVFLDPTTQMPFVFSSLVEKLVGKVRLCSIFPILTGCTNQDYIFNELVYLSTPDGNRQISQSNGTIMNIFKPNYEKYIDVGFQKLVEDFLFKNRAYVSATIWGHGGVGKTACIQKICYDLFNKSTRHFSYVIFITAKDRIYNPKTGKINPSAGNISLYSEVIRAIAEVLFDEVETELKNEKISEYEQRISNFEDTFLIIIDDYETFEDSEKEKISNFLGMLNAHYHKAVITTRNRRFAIGQSISCNELDCFRTRDFITAVIKEQYPAHSFDMEQVLKNDQLLTCVFKATSGRPIFIYQFIYLFMQKGYQEDLISGIRTSSNAQEFLYGRIYQYLGKHAQYIFSAISTLTDDDLRFNLNILEHVLSKVINEKDQFEAGLEELVNQRIIETVNEVYGRVYSTELLEIMTLQYQKCPQDFQHTIKNLLDGIGGKNIKGSIFEAMLEQADRSRAFGNEQETIEKYRRLLNSTKVSHVIQKTAIKHLADFLSNTRLNTPSAIAVVKEYLHLFPDDADIYMFYTYLLWSQGKEEKGTAVNVIQEFFSVSNHRKTDPRYLTYFALGTGYCIDFDIRYRDYPKATMRNNQYAKTFNEYGKILFQYVKSHLIKGKPQLFHNIRVALVQTVKLCDAIGRDERNSDKIAYGLEICNWMQQSDVKEPFLNQITRLKNNLQAISANTFDQNNISLYINPQMETEFTEHSDMQDSYWSNGHQYNIGDLVDGTVTRIMPYGVFVSLDTSTQGLIHISAIANRYIADIGSEFTVGESCVARIANIDPSTRRISLSTIEFHP